MNQIVVLRGPENRPSLAVIIAGFLLLLAAFVGVFGWLGVPLFFALLLSITAWERIRPQRRAGQVRRTWPHHDD